MNRLRPALASDQAGSGNDGRHHPRIAAPRASFTTWSTSSGGISSVIAGYCARNSRAELDVRPCAKICVAVSRQCSWIFTQASFSIAAIRICATPANPAEGHGRNELSRDAEGLTAFGDHLAGLGDFLLGGIVGRPPDVILT
jgi:hypothetical protein